MNPPQRTPNTLLEFIDQLPMGVTFEIVRDPLWTKIALSIVVNEKCWHSTRTISNEAVRDAVNDLRLLVSVRLLRELLIAADAALATVG